MENYYEIVVSDAFNLASYVGGYRLNHPEETLTTTTPNTNTIER